MMANRKKVKAEAGELYPPSTSLRFFSRRRRGAHTAREKMRVSTEPVGAADVDRSLSEVQGNLVAPSLRWKGITMRKMLLAFAAFATLVVSAASPAYAGPPYDYGPGGNPYPRTYPGAGGYPYWSGYVDAPVGEPMPPCRWISQRFWDGHGWRGRQVRVCG